MERKRAFSRKFKLEAVKLVTERGVSGLGGQASGRAPERATQMGWPAVRGAAGSLPGQWQADGPGRRDSAAAQGSGQAKNGARHLEKSCALLRQGAAVKFGFVAKHREAWPVDLVCEARGVSRGGFYAWLTRPGRQRSLSR